MVEAILDLFHSKTLSGSVIAVIYDTYSSAWQIPFLLLRDSLGKGYFPVISNYSVSFNSLIHRGRSVGLDLKTELDEGRMAVVDVFGSRYSPVHANIPGVFYLDKVEPETINPKIDIIYSQLREELGEDTKLFRLIYTLDGVSIMFGEEKTIKLLNQTIAEKSVKCPESVLLIALNSDVVSKRSVAWTVNLSDYALLARSRVTEEGVKELLYPLKSTSVDFEPKVYSLEVRKGEERIHLEKLSTPELRPPAEEQR
ncbi:hypothetical protein A0127_09080 [Thermococcus peptonophilus]|uniref:KaiC-like domain-containing protein n=2 Tax=Thermococcus peptonophilus TaxID=53952 RepID=A0A142CXR3_9EURY|nr:hypothetical protein A0127_09080 [Thermococcus peptonophilus]